MPIWKHLLSRQRLQKRRLHTSIRHRSSYGHLKCSCIHMHTLLHYPVDELLTACNLFIPNLICNCSSDAEVYVLLSRVLVSNLLYCLLNSSIWFENLSVNTKQMLALKCLKLKCRITFSTICFKRIWMISRGLFCSSPRCAQTLLRSLLHKQSLNVTESDAGLV